VGKFGKGSKNKNFVGERKKNKKTQREVDKENRR
jgi:hypothetical protein